ncbi:alpha/beta fold hydrolase [Maritimibacter sp. HL-12]|uniref:alpha/beta fold hydrolase n=1 Tax=Maritimibacter sp. HL-12 TaxID=1162418 RepID=UPI000A0F23B5|nr:alpha/beta hydrolase [Maritimibacter sp. HL-12]SMH42393.1 Pimeloyl-ACP methyl ester carboxylesterase [Maritimibacter sp. HL-12]
MNHPPMRSKPQVLALHCTGGTPRQWDPLAAGLADFAAFHAPPLPRFPETSRPTLTAQAAPLLDWLDRTPAPVHVVGHSHGGALALHLAGRRPDRVASLSLYEPAAFHLLRDCGKPGERALWELLDVALAVRRALAEGRRDHGARRFVTYWGGDAAWDTLDEGTRLRIGAVLEQGLAGFEALRSENAGAGAPSVLRCPVDLLIGSRSYNPARLATERLATLIPAARTREVRGAAHMGPLTHADVVHDILATSLRERIAGQATRAA